MFLNKRVSRRFLNGLGIVILLLMGISWFVGLIFSGWIGSEKFLLRVLLIVFLGLREIVVFESLGYCKYRSFFSEF